MASLSPARIAILVAVAAAAFAAWQLASRPALEAQDAAAGAATALVARTDTARLTVAVTNLELQRRTTGSYAGATMPSGVALRRADAAGFCVELADGGQAAHLTGPGGVPTAGPC